MREASDVITLILTLDSGKIISERFTYDATQNVWHLTTSAAATPLVALPQSSDTWVFTGNEGAGRPVRILYTTLGPLAFRREHQVSAQNGWVDDAETVCKRTSATVATAASPSPTPAAYRRTAPPMPTRRPVLTQAMFVAPTPPPVKTRAPATPAPSRAPASPPPGRDRASHLVGGTWDCETIEGNSAPHTYTRARDGSIDLHTALAIGNKTFAIDERYQFDGGRNTWTTTTLGGAYSATAAPWLGDKWVFDGFAQVDGRRVPERMIYTDLDGRAFRRDFRQLRGTGWETVASETCKRR